MDIGAFEFQFGGPAPALYGIAGSSTGQFQFAFTNNSPEATFTVLSTTNLSLALEDWTVLGAPTRTASGQFRFSDPQTTNNPQRFYRVSSP